MSIIIGLKANLGQTNLSRKPTQPHPFLGR